MLLLLAGGVRRIEWLLFAHVLGLSGAAFLAWFALEREVGRLRFAPTFADRDLLRDFARFGGAVQLASFGPQLADQAFRLVIGLRFGAAWMGFYDLGARAALVLRSVAGTLLVPMVPFGVQQQMEGGVSALTKLFQLTLKYTALWLLPASALALYHSPLLISVWLGHTAGAAEVLTVFQVFIVVNALVGLAAPIAMLGRAAGVPGAEAVLVTITASVGVLAARFLPGTLACLLVF
jgi:O-antigen/teichoic acid export membrane protein